MRFIFTAAAVVALFSCTGCDDGKPLGGPISIRVKSNATDQRIRRQDGGFLGAGIEEDDERAGATIATMVPDGPAELAGLNVGDSVTAIDGVVVTKKDEFMAIAEKWKHNQLVKLTVQRGEQELEITATLIPLQELVRLQNQDVETMKATTSEADPDRP
jgi:S1-C subfamily serine protease